jgi:hypothetical protein
MEDAKPESTAALESKAEKENPPAKKSKEKQPRKAKAAPEPDVEQEVEEEPAEELAAIEEIPTSKPKSPKPATPRVKNSSKTVSISSGREAEVES